MAVGLPLAVQVQPRGRTRWSFCGSGPELFSDLVMVTSSSLGCEMFLLLLAFLGGPASHSTACLGSCTALTPRGHWNWISVSWWPQEYPESQGHWVAAPHSGLSPPQPPANKAIVMEVLQDPAGEVITAEHLFPVVFSSVAFLNGWSGTTDPILCWCDSGLQHEQEVLLIGNMCVAALLWRLAQFHSLVPHFISQSQSQKVSPLLFSLVQLQSLGQISLQRVLFSLSKRSPPLLPVLPCLCNLSYIYCHHLHVWGFAEGAEVQNHLRAHLSSPFCYAWQ